MNYQSKIVKDYEARAVALGVSMHAITKRAGVSYATWWYMKNGTRSVTVATLQKLNEAIEGLEAERTAKPKPKAKAKA